MKPKFKVEVVRPYVHREGREPSKPGVALVRIDDGPEQWVLVDATYRDGFEVRGVLDDAKGIYSPYFNAIIAPWQRYCEGLCECDSIVHPDDLADYATLRKKSAQRRRTDDGELIPDGD